MVPIDSSQTRHIDVVLRPPLSSGQNSTCLENKDKDFVSKNAEQLSVTFSTDALIIVANYLQGAHMARVPEATVNISF